MTRSTRSILIAMAAVAALATAPSLAASTLTWEQEARVYAPYAFGGVDAVETGSFATDGGYVPYTGFGDPLGLTSSTGIDAVETGSVTTFGAYVPYTGLGDPLGLTSPVYTDATETGSIGAPAPRVDVQGFCEGEGKELAERLYIGFCHFAQP